MFRNKATFHNGNDTPEGMIRYILSEVKNNRPYQQQISTKENYAFNKADWSHLRSLFSYSPWDLTLEQQEINVNWEVWKDLYFTVVNESIPKYRLKRKNIAPWITIF